MQTGTQKAQLGIVGNLSYQFAPSQRISLRELLHAQRPRRRPVLPGAQPRQRPRVPELPAAVHRRRADGQRHRRRALLPEPVEQPLRLAGELRARDARRAGPARDAVRAAVEQRGRTSSLHLRRRVAERLPDVQRAQRRHGRRCRATGASSTPRAAGRRSTSSASTTSSARATSSRAASTSFRSRRRRPTPATCSSTTRCRRRRSSSPSNIGTAFRFNEETRPTDAYRGRPDDHVGVRHGRHRDERAARGSSPAPASSASIRPSPRRIRSGCSPARCRRRTRTPTSSRPELRAGRHAPTRTSASATARRSTGRSSASWRSSSSPTSSATAR